jgi:hypothetical protein
MREIRQSGSEGGVTPHRRHPYPIESVVHRVDGGRCHYDAGSEALALVLALRFVAQCSATHRVALSSQALSPALAAMSKMENHFREFWTG